MASRIEVELTSARPDGTWTWRAAGAREPRGVVSAGVVYEGARVGDVVKAEAEVGLDGISLTSIVPPRRRAEDGNRIEVVGSPPPGAGTVTTAVGGGRSSRERHERPRGERPPRPRGSERGDRPRGSERQQRPRGGERGDRPRGSDRAERVRPAGERAAAGRAPAGRAHADGDQAGRAPVDPGRASQRRRGPGHVHRRELLAGLSSEQVPVAEQLLRGGLPAVRQATAEQNERARRGESPPVDADAVLAIAEQLLPRARLAQWRDRADAAARDVDKVPLRDLRALVAGASVAGRDEEARQVAASLRSALSRRLEKSRSEWCQRIEAALAEGRVTDALDLSGRPSDPGARISAEMAGRLRDAAGAALAPEAPAQEWLALLEAVAASPVRRVVKPVGLPEAAPPEVVRAATRLAGQVPALAALVGMDIPPPPRPLRPPPPVPSAAAQAGG